jgi:hypothetical protein
MSSFTTSDLDCVLVVPLGYCLRPNSLSCNVVNATRLVVVISRHDVA